MTSVFGTVVALFKQPELSPPRTCTSTEPQRLSTRQSTVVMAHFRFFSCNFHHSKILMGDFVFVAKDVLISIVGFVEPVVFSWRVHSGVMVLIDPVFVIRVNNHHFPICQGENLIAFLDNLEVSESMINPFDWRRRFLCTILCIENSESFVVVHSH